MNTLDFELWLGSLGYFPEKYYVTHLSDHTPDENQQLIVDYHHNYMRLRARIEELEGKIYALQETIDGREPTVERKQLSGWP